MWHLLVVFDVEGVALDFDDCALVLVDVAVVGRAEDRDHAGQLQGLLPVMDLVTLHLHLMRPYHEGQVVVVKQFLRGGQSVLAGAVPL